MGKRECEDLEMLSDRNMTRKIFQKVKRQIKGFKTETSSCKDENGNLMTNVQGIPRLWRNHFAQLLNGGSSNVDNEVEIDTPVVDDGIVVTPPDLKEVRITISPLKNNKSAKADGLPVELFKAGGKELVHRMQQLLCKIWLD